MKKKMVKRHIQKRKYTKRFRFKGISWISILLAVLGGSVVIGGVMYLPTSKRTPVNNRYLTIPDPNCKGDNLHLCTFIIVTITPTPDLENVEVTWGPQGGKNTPTPKKGGGKPTPTKNPKKPTPTKGGAKPL